jgi:hypothetical protein
MAFATMELVQDVTHTRIPISEHFAAVKLAAVLHTLHLLDCFALFLLSLLSSSATNQAKLPILFGKYNSLSHQSLPL